MRREYQGGVQSFCMTRIYIFPSRRRSFEEEEGRYFPYEEEMMRKLSLGRKILG